jgi:hypothetical protein
MQMDARIVHVAMFNQVTYNVAAVKSVAITQDTTPQDICSHLNITTGCTLTNAERLPFRTNEPLVQQGVQDGGCIYVHPRV